MEKTIKLPRLMREEDPALAACIDGINATLAAFPNITLAEYAEQVNKRIKRASLARIERAEEKQFDGGF